VHLCRSSSDWVCDWECVRFEVFFADLSVRLSFDALKHAFVAYWNNFTRVRFIRTMLSFFKPSCWWSLLILCYFHWSVLKDGLKNKFESRIFFIFLPISQQLHNILTSDYLLSMLQFLHVSVSFISWWTLPPPVVITRFNLNFTKFI
jgi:hypothetical protein